MSVSMCGERAVRSTLLLFAACLFLIGCARRGDRSEAHPTTEEYPSWVRMVPAADEGTRYYVGGCALASSLEEGIALATEDVEFEAALEERGRFMRLFDEALGDARTETTPGERARLRNEGSERYSKAIPELLQVEDVHYRGCAGGEEKGAVCDVFVLFTLDEDDVDGNLARSLEVLRAAFREEGNATLQAVVERMQRLLSRQ